MAEIVFFHLGLHKTATGWFQRQLFPVLELPVYRTRKFDKIRAYVATDPHRAIIVSHEGLGGRITDDKKQGDALATFLSTLDRIEDIPGERKLLIGFREQTAWINSAYGQRAKKGRISPERYRDSFSLADLLWMQRVQQCEAHGLESFFFLYEEFDYAPLALLTDVCAFLQLPTPANAEGLLQRRENISPRSERGFRLARLTHLLAQAAGALSLFDAKGLRRRGAEWASLFDDAKSYPPSIAFGDGEAELLRKDWRDLVSHLSAKRGRDLSPLASGWSPQPAARA